MKNEQQVTIVGSGIVGTMIAYELSHLPNLSITVCDRRAAIEPDLTASLTATSAALGVLMGAISKRPKGQNLQRRLASLQHYETLIPQLVAQTGQEIPFNQQGLLMLQFTGADLSDWERLVKVRQDQGWPLEIWPRDRLQTAFPHLNYEHVIAGIYSARDRQVNPVALTQALIAAAQQRGVTYRWATEVIGIAATADPLQRCHTLHTTTGTLPTDWLIIAAGLGSTPLTQTLGQPLLLQPVLGQAIQLKLAAPLIQHRPQPVITGHDVHLVPLTDHEYWIGATVEFSPAAVPAPNPADFTNLMAQAIALFPALSTATPQRTWYGLRPRPQGRPAPVIERLAGYGNVLVATGHYRNGVLLAPATAMAVRQIMVEGCWDELSV
jgi:glycine/D-amino acid oxidase-like deaminating enzyme